MAAETEMAACHHLGVHCFIVGPQMVLTPTFIGAEPTEADRGTHKGLRLFDEQRTAGLDLRRSLHPEQARQAVLYTSIRLQDLPAELADPVNGRHLGGAAQDNRVIPYTGLPANRAASRRHAHRRPHHRAHPQRRRLRARPAAPTPRPPPSTATHRTLTPRPPQTASPWSDTHTAAERSATGSPVSHREGMVSWTFGGDRYRYRAEARRPAVRLVADVHSRPLR
ncbi:DUF3500 domain-containing protein [Actinomadura macra]|uniref:DUF3500 domain-containing protein n=1 Tax=Actinomadura macra TaxID=46164 RepID=UPI000AFCCF41|nr:DUF3500 domain-containing protein [Actinomadura macra]